MSIAVAGFRTTREGEIREWAEHSPRMWHGWVVRSGAIEVRRAVDEEAISFAQELLRSVALNRYPQDPEIKEALRDARDALMAARRLIVERNWSAYKNDEADR